MLLRRNNALGSRVLFSILFIQGFLIRQTYVFLFKTTESFPVRHSYEIDWHKNVKISKVVSLQEQMF